MELFGARYGYRLVKKSCERHIFRRKSKDLRPQWEAGRVQPCSLEALPGCPMPNIDIDREEPCGVGRSLLPSQKPAALWVYALSKA